MFIYETTENGYQMAIPTEFGNYKATAVLNRGSTCIVLLAQNSINYKTYAVKAISKEYIQIAGIEHRIKNEIKILNSISHPNIIHIEEVLELDGLYLIVMEYCPNGDLYQILGDPNQYAKMDKFKIVQDILNALHHLHSNGIAHGDIKAENIVFDENYNAKLTDFGYSKTSFVAGDNEKVGSIYYVSPEMLHHGIYDTMKADTWAFGILLCLLFSGQFPFQILNDGNDGEFLISQISNGYTFLPKELNPIIKCIIRKCISNRAENRPSIEQLINFFKEWKCENKNNLIDMFKSVSLENFFVRKY
ncbi:CAMK family protein kinase [Tritrichomonas foetus]|uniref:CAMK family protein kinase n=1 Tax=Tritrichomonas foetus TaxID=1144522 RepID=A0A1J4JT40_9EUKA|nr:CAMK family protein kinase [Tritrichomonas foetus]|eukprot:OHT02287.1 CAMK family protein kinase [Tritrichomonas foetus]